MKRALLTTTVVLGTALLATPVAAQASDSSPCGSPVKHRVNGANRNVQYCPLTQGHVPVYQSPTSRSKVIGYLNQGGSANWFEFQSCTAYWYNSVLKVTDYPLRKGSYVNGWWAYTLSDPPSRFGYVNEVYFKGGGNYEADRGLVRAGPGSGSDKPTKYCRF